MTGTGVMGIGRGRPQKQPTEEDRKPVRTHTAMGTPQDIIGQLLGYSPKTLRKYFRRELTLSKHQANAEVAGYLFAAAK